MNEIKYPSVGQLRSKRSPKKKGGRKLRPRISALTPPSKIDWTELLKDSIAQPPIPQKSLGDLIVDALKTAYNQTWKETDPESYLFYQATWEVAPYWPPELGWLLNLTALGAIARGAARIADKGKKSNSRR